MYANLIKDNFVKLTRMAAIGTAAASLSLVSTILPSFAALAPSCIKITSQSSTSIRVNNTCGIQQKVKVVLAFAPDKACTAINPGQNTLSWKFGRFDRLESC